MKTRLPSQRGFTLVELMIAVAILIVVLIALYATLGGAQRTAMENTREVQVRDTGRVAIQLMERDLRMAGSGWGLVPVETSNSGVPYQLRGVMPGPGGKSDSIRILGSWGAQTRLSQDMPLTTSPMRVDSVQGFKLPDEVGGASGYAHAMNIEDEKLSFA